MHLAACSASGFISIMARWSSTLNKENVVAGKSQR
jgi:hypothetical protein